MKHVETDVRRDQLKILKFERRFLRPMASQLLSSSSSKAQKILAISAASAYLAMIATAPGAYGQKIGVELAGLEYHASACVECEALRALVSADANAENVEAALGELFRTVDRAHHYWEKLALAAGARLIPVRGVDQEAVGTGGGNKTNASWLTRAKMSAR